MHTGYMREWQIIGKRGGDKAEALVPVSHATLWRWVKAGKFPAPVNLGGKGGRISAWRACEVDGWLASRQCTA